ncbi:MAG TPA: DNA repair protein RecO [Candidatus Acidoferrum sp.]|nr:DNA repair protein RecO [Candidatus Acidoferrum sp.]
MIQNATGLILRTRPLTETSLIVHWLTPSFGRIATVARGARRAKSPFLGRLDLFYQADFSFSRSRRSALHTLREVRLSDTQNALRGDLHRLRLAAYAAAFIEQATETETPLPAVYELLSGLLDSLKQHPASPQLVFAFELKLLRELGLQPDPEKLRLTPGAKQIVRTLTQGGWPAAWRLKLAPAQQEELRQFLHGFLIFHLGRLPAGRAGAVAGD